MGDVAALAGLFFAAFASATLVPAQSEALLAGMTVAGLWPPLALLIVASVANVLGACLNWWIGGLIDRVRHHRWFPVSESALTSARRTYGRWGWPSLFLSWVPVVGDPLTFAAGVMKEPLWRFVAVVGAAKTLRYAVVIAMAERLSA